ASLVMNGTTTQIVILGQLVATVQFPATSHETAINMVENWSSATGKYTLSIECSFEGTLSLNPDGLAALTRMIPHIQGSISGRMKGVEAPYDRWMSAVFGRGVNRAATTPKSTPMTPAPLPHA